MDRDKFPIIGKGWRDQQQSE